MKVQTQTVWAPAITTLLYLIIFTIALGGIKPSVLGVPFADFIAPGLIIMGMMQNSFANSSFSLLVGKIQGTIVDYLMPPCPIWNCWSQWWVRRSRARRWWAAPSGSPWRYGRASM